MIPDSFSPESSPVRGSLPAPQRLELDVLETLFSVLKAAGYRVVGPTVRDEAIIFDELDSARMLPIGWTDEQGPGHYRLKRRADEARFGYVVGPQSWKKYLHPSRLRLWRASRQQQSFSIEAGREEVPRYAFIGVRSCDLAAIHIQDRVLGNGQHADPTYVSAREQVFLVSVQCTQAASTCFCVSMQSGPRAREGFDLALTEVIDSSRHYFVLEVGSPRGLEIALALRCAEASSSEQAEALRLSQRAAEQQSRSLNTDGLKELLYRNHENPRWDEVASRCLSCGNCTMACPTCFCTTVEDVTDLSGDHAERWRRWDSCFTADFSYIHGGSVRPSVSSRYRQWLTHKLASWQDQFGTSGCVGCGRCIAWCPVGIDLTEESQALRLSELARPT